MYETVIVEHVTSTANDLPDILLQLVWATTSRVGCAVHICPAMNVWGEIWENAVYLVCNYSPK